jgi:hypothetical protein
MNSTSFTHTQILIIMKKLFVTFFLLAAGIAQAQYFQNYNGIIGNFEQSFDGTNVVAGGQGHLIAGTTDALGQQDLLLTRTDVNGVIAGLNSFNQVYRLQLPTGAPLWTSPCKILQVASGNICVVGNYNSPLSPGPQGIFTAVLSPAGAVINVTGWQVISPSAVTSLVSLSACRALAVTSNNVFICGYTDALTPGAALRPFVLAINGNTNAFIWGRVYNYLPATATGRCFATDLVASPYATTIAGEIMVIGNYFDGLGNDFGFTYRVNAGNGNPIGLVTQFDSGRNEEFWGITVASGPGGGGDGYVITGSTNVNGSLDALTIKTDRAGSGVRWATTHDYSNLTRDNSGTDVIQRQNTSGRWLYYVCGTTQAGALGATDAAVFQIDDNTGNAVAEFTYGTGADESAVEISSFSGTAADGITVYGNTNRPDVGEEYLVKAYYNGVSGCLEAFGTPFTQPYPLSRTQFTNTRNLNFGGSTLVATTPLSATMNVICFAVVVPGGSNLRVANNDIEQTTLTSLYPNPVSASSPLIQIQLTSSADQQIEIRITDMLGREVHNQQIMVTEGQSLHQIQLPSGLGTGMYNLNVINGEAVENHRFVIE